MSMSTHVEGIRPPDDNWLRMKAAYDACVAARIAIPREVDDFFNGETPDPLGVVVPLDRTPAVREYRVDMSEGLEVDLDQLPPGVKIVRFYNSY